MCSECLHCYRGVIGDESAQQKKARPATDTDDTLVIVSHKEQRQRESEHHGKVERERLFYGDAH